MTYVIHMPSTYHLKVDTSSTTLFVILFIYPIIYNSVSTDSLHKHTLSMLFKCCPPHVHIIQRLGWLMIYIIHMSNTCHLKVDTSSTLCLWYSLYILSSTTQFPHILYTNAHCQYHVDVVHTCKHDTQIWLLKDIHHLYVIHMLSAGL